MASIQKRPGGSWRARYRDDAGREHARHFTRKVDGQRWLDEQTATIVTGQYVDPRAGRVTVTAYAQQWRAWCGGRRQRSGSSRHCGRTCSRCSVSGR